MLEWMIGLLAVATVIAKVLEFFDLIDPFELIVAVLKLTAGLLFAVGAFFVYRVRRRTREKRSCRHGEGVMGCPLAASAGPATTLKPADQSANCSLPSW